MKVNWDDADTFVAEQQSKGADFRWDGYEIVHFQPHPAGFYKGVYRNGTYGFESRFDVNRKGDFHVTRRLVV